MRTIAICLTALLLSAASTVATAAPPRPSKEQLSMGRSAMGQSAGEAPRISLTAPVDVKAPLAYYLPVKLRSDDWGRTSAEPCPTNGSGDFTALAGTDGFVELPPGPHQLPKGFVARFFRW